MNCRHCQSPLSQLFADLVTCPPSNAMVPPEREYEPEKYFPLKVFVCTDCWLVQTDELEKAGDIFNAEYTYFSSFSTSWVAHAQKYVDMMVDRFGFNSSSHVIEIASNDGYLLQWFVKKGIPVLGVDPTANTAAAAKQKGVDTLVDFFGRKIAREKLVPEGLQADLILGNNVLAHVPDINDLVGGIKLALKQGGVATMEFPHLMRLVDENQFDTIYHEHFSYLSLTFVNRLFASQGLTIFDVEEWPTHGGSLRIFARHDDDSTKPVLDSVRNLLKKEEDLGMKAAAYYDGFQEEIDKIKYAFWEFLIEQKRAGKTVVAYGAAAKGNTLMNYAGLKGTDLIQYVADASPHKQNKLNPGSRTPVRHPDEIKRTKPDYVIVFPWNLSEEISQQLSYIREWGGQFVRFVPERRVW